MIKDRQKKVIVFVIAMLTTAGLGISSGTYYIFNRSDMIYPLLWTRGCSPTAASMGLMVYDYVTPIGLLTPGGQYYGFLVQNYLTHPVSHRNVPNTVDWVADRMGTDGSGGTPWNNIHSGILAFTNTDMGYSFSSTQVGSCTNPLQVSCYDWCWLTITTNIAMNRPFVWSVYTAGGGGRAHSLCAFGYSDQQTYSSDKYVVTRNTWDTSEDWWLYNYYDNTYAADYVQVDTIVPGGGTDSSVTLDDPVGGEVINGGQSYNIWWYQWGSNRISKVMLYYSADDGAHFSLIGQASSAPGYNSYSWSVPNTYKNRARIHIWARDSYDDDEAADGSIGSFMIEPALTIATSPSGLSIVVDGTTYTAPHSFNWQTGSVHTIGVTSPQSGGAGTRYLYSSWSDGGAQTHSITAPAAVTTYTANFAAQYSLTTTANPPAGGTIAPAGTTWYDSNQSVAVQAISNTGYVFTGWSGSLAGYANPTTIVMNGPKNVTANFSSGKALLAPILALPCNGVTGQPFTVTLTWQDPNSSPQELKYKVRIKKAGGAYQNYTLAANTTSFVKSGLAPGKTYYWNVEALGNGTSIKNSPWANGGVDFKFTTMPPVTLTMPTLLGPANGSTGQPTTITLSWADTNTQELAYKVRIKKAGGTYAFIKVAANTVSLLRSGLARNKTYYWSVQALGKGTSIKNSAWPADWKFTTAN